MEYLNSPLWAAIDTFSGILLHVLPISLMYQIGGGETSELLAERHRHKQTLDRIRKEICELLKGHGTDPRLRLLADEIGVELE